MRFSSVGVRAIAALTIVAASCAGSDTGDAARGDGSDLGTDDVMVDTGALPDRPFNDPFICQPSGTVPLLDEPLDGTQVRAGQVARTEELVRGEGAYGRVGDFKLYNDRVQFIVQGRVDTHGPRLPTGYDLYGGNVIDADRVRRAGERGHDVLREIFPLIGLRVPGADEVRVVCDGTGGRPAVVRVTGIDQSSRLLPFDSLARRRLIRIITHYILRPASEVLEIRTTIDPIYGQQIDSIQIGEFLAFGAGTTIHTSLGGFRDPSGLRMPAPFIAAVSDPGENDRHVSYAIAAARGGVDVPTVDASGTAALYTDISVPLAGYADFTRYFSVGTGDIASATGPLFRIRNDPFGTIRGTTTPGALVYAYARPYRLGAAVLSAARAAMDGSFSIPIAPGDYDVLAVDTGRVRGTPVQATVANGATVTANPTAGPTGTLVLDIATLATGGGRVRAPMKVTLVGTDVEMPDSAMGSLEGERENSGAFRVAFTVNGMDRVTLKPGHYRAIVSRGPEYETSESMIDVPAAGEVTLTADLRRVVDTTGYISGDFHQHTIGSVDSPRALCNRVLENAAEGLEYAATTDHDNVTDFGPCIRSLGVTNWFGAMMGNEISVNGVGHFNAYPLAIEAANPDRLIGAQYWADLTPQALFDRIRAEPSDPVLHVSHPRSTFKGYFTYLQLNPITLATNAQRPIARGYHAIEVNESLGAPEDFLASADRAIEMAGLARPADGAVLHDYFALINRGARIAALGNSDTHTRNNGSGWPRNFMRVGIDEPAMVTPAMVRTAIRSQRVIVSGGIFIRVRVGGNERMGSNELVRATGGMAELEIEIQAPAWVPVTRFSLFENGRPLSLTSTGMDMYDTTIATSAAGVATAVTGTATVRWHGTVRVRPMRDSTYVVVARGTTLRPVEANDAFGYTNPVYVDADGNGMWQPPTP